MTKIRTVVFDFDGVLAESNQVKDGAFEALFALYPEHREEMRAYHIAHHSRPRREKFEHFVSVLMGCPGDRDLVEEMAGKFSELVFDRVVACPPVPGSREFLQEFAGRIPLYVSSVTPQDELRAILKARELESFITKAFGNPPVPKAEAIARILERERVQPDEVAFVGDSLSDYQAAASAGLVFWGRDSGQDFADAEVELFPDLHGIAAAMHERL